MTPDAEPRTEAGKRLLAEISAPGYDGSLWLPFILAIEAEAATPTGSSSRELDDPADSLDALRAAIDERIAFYKANQYVPSYRLVLGELEPIAAALRAEGSSKPEAGPIRARWRVGPASR